MTVETFPWPFVLPAPLLPSMSDATPHDHHRDASILEWFARVRGGGSNTRGPLRRWIDSLRSVAGGGPLHDVPKHEQIVGGEASSPRNLAAIVDYYAARQVIHSIRLIETMALERKIDHLEIDPYFVRAELRRPDYTASDRPTLPGGGGTLLLAGACARVGAQHLVIHSSKSQGVDVEWTTPTVLARRDARRLHRLHPPRGRDGRRWSGGGADTPSRPRGRTCRAHLRARSSRRRGSAAQDRAQGCGRAALQWLGQRAPAAFRRPPLARLGPRREPDGRIQSSPLHRHSAGDAPDGEHDVRRAQGTHAGRAVLIEGTPHSGSGGSPRSSATRSRSAS